MVLVDGHLKRLRCLYGLEEGGGSLGPHKSSDPVTKAMHKGVHDGALIHGGDVGGNPLEHSDVGGDSAGLPQISELHPGVKL